MGSRRRRRLSRVFQMSPPFVSLISAGRLRPWMAGAAIALATFTARGDWQLVWSDEFNGVSIDTNHWKFEMGNRHGWGNHELEYYTDRPENVCVSNGVLHIVAQPKPDQWSFLHVGPPEKSGAFCPPIRSLRISGEISRRTGLLAGDLADARTFDLRQLASLW